MSLNKYLDVSPEVAEAVAAGKPVVALESTIISHGMPYPQNVETALKVESIIRENGAVPATIAILGGRLKAGLTPEEIEYLGKKGHEVTKASRRDLAVLVSKGADGATTVTTTMMIAYMAGIRIFATGGIGGVHRGAETTMDISADLEELAQTPVMVVCAGAKSILDLGLTLEYLETHGVPVIGYGTKELPAFYTRKSGFAVDYELDSPAELAAAFKASQDMGLKGGMLVTNPIPEEFSMDPAVINKAIDEAIAQANAQGIHGKESTPFLLAKVKELTGGDSLDSNIQLVFNNARLAAQTMIPRPAAPGGGLDFWSGLWYDGATMKERAEDRGKKEKAGDAPGGVQPLLRKGQGRIPDGQKALFHLDLRDPWCDPGAAHRTEGPGRVPGAGLRRRHGHRHRHSVG